ncbi:MAG: DMT family transporter [Paracoccaceae bacterium]
MASIESDSGQVVRGVLLILGAILCFDTMSIIVRFLLPYYTAPELSAYRNVLGIVPSLALMLWTRELRFRGSKLYIRKWPVAVARGLAVALAQLCFYTALGHLELATVSALAQTNAMFVVLLSVLMLGEKVGPWRISAVVLGFVGAVWILRPGSDAFSVWALAPVGAALCYSYSMITVRVFDRDVSNALLFLYASVAAAVGAVIIAWFTTDFTPIRSLVDGGLIFIMATLGGVGVLFMMLAYRMAAPSALAPFTYFSLLSAFLFGWVIFGEAPVDTLFPGVLLIVGAGALIIWRENHVARQT